MYIPIYIYIFTNEERFLAQIGVCAGDLRAALYNIGIPAHKIHFQTQFQRWHTI